MTGPRISSDAEPDVHRIVVLRGDGIGPELMECAMVVIDAVLRKHSELKLEFIDHEAGAGLFLREGTSMQPETMEAIEAADAMFKAPVGLPDVRSDEGTEAGLLGGLRIGLDTYANVRPIRLMPGIDAPIKAAPGSIDYVIVRENTEGM